LSAGTVFSTVYTVLAIAGTSSHMESVERYSSSMSWRSSSWKLAIFLKGLVMTLKLETLPGNLAVTEGEKQFISALKKEKVGGRPFTGCNRASKGGYWDAEGSLKAFRKKTREAKHRLQRSGLGRVLLRKGGDVLGAGTYVQKLILQVDAFQTTAAYSLNGKRFDPSVFLPDGMGHLLEMDGLMVTNMGLLEGVCVLPSAGLRGSGADSLIKGLTHECLKGGGEFVASLAVSKQGMRALERNGFTVSRTVDRGEGETTFYMVYMKSII
jgi:hypothetical protein